MQLEIELTPDDYWAFNKTAASGRTANPGLEMAVSVAMWAALGYAGLHLFHTGVQLDYSVARWLAGPGMILVLVIVWTRLSQRHQRSVFEPLPGRFILERKNFVFTSEAIEVSGDNSTSRYTWGAVVDVVDTDDHFFLFLDSTVSLIVPKRVFDYEEAALEFRENVATWRSN